MTEVAKLAVEVFSWGDDEWLDDVSGLENDVRVVTVVAAADKTYQPDDHDIACSDFTGRGPHL